MSGTSKLPVISLLATQCAHIQPGLPGPAQETSPSSSPQSTFFAVYQPHHGHGCLGTYLPFPLHQGHWDGLFLFAHAAWHAVALGPLVSLNGIERPPAACNSPCFTGKAGKLIAQDLGMQNRGATSSFLRL